MSDILIVQSKVKEVIKKQGCNTASDAVDAMSKQVEGMIKKAIDRCKANGRKTVKATDF